MMTSQLVGFETEAKATAARCGATGVDREGAVDLAMLHAGTGFAYVMWWGPAGSPHDARLIVPDGAGGTTWIDGVRNVSRALGGA